jgi:hypothetical protein
MRATSGGLRKSPWTAYAILLHGRRGDDSPAQAEEGYEGTIDCEIEEPLSCLPDDTL